MVTSSSRWMIFCYKNKEQTGLISLLHPLRLSTQLRIPAWPLPLVNWIRLQRDANGEGWQAPNLGSQQCFCTEAHQHGHGRGDGGGNPTTHAAILGRVAVDVLRTWTSIL